jgi:hypothetical protein
MGPSQIQLSSVYDLLAARRRRSRTAESTPDVRLHHWATTRTCTGSAGRRDCPPVARRTPPGRVHLQGMLVALAAFFADPAAMGPDV